MTEKGRNLLGKLLLAAGAFSSFLFLSPVMPVGPEGLLIGCVFFGLGGWVLAGPELRSRIRRLLTLKRADRSRFESSAAMDPMLPVRVLRLARERAGILTLSEAAVALDMPIGQVEEALRFLANQGIAQEEYSVSRGYSLYRFPEFLPPGDLKAGQ